ncbi:hypothetical protein XM38_014590 [Halomicronema hongdechloris C2206]|uniref:Long-chain-fatty-acid--CoA ligase n=1 Tax=Halomicronema hongdechloris C2206 TaxID=1641165 RepID=A0A1Z3HJP7_9CYAN|nr:hypothetical protein XM38_014590 [Halomicronema hongdechloris C2206]
MRPDEQLLVYLPLFHCFGQNAILNSGFNACATIILQRRLNQSKSWKLLPLSRLLPLLRTSHCPDLRIGKINRLF